MGRPRKLEPSVLVALVDGYYEEKAAGNAAKIRFSSLEAYAEEKGYTVKSYDFSRCREAVVRIEELKNSEEMRREETLAAAYKSLDVEGLLKQCTTVEALKETLIRMDGYWKRTYMEASALITRDRAFMQEKGKLDGKIRSLKEERPPSGKRERNAEGKHCPETGERISQEDAPHLPVSGNREPDP